MAWRTAIVSNHAKNTWKMAAFDQHYESTMICLRVKFFQHHSRYIVNILWCTLKRGRVLPYLRQFNIYAAFNAISTLTALFSMYSKI